MNFPGHKYLGPGNESNRGEPVDRDDAIAREHDIDYDNARSHKEVRAADRKAIKNFTGDLVTTGNWHSGVGAAGLATKYTAETVTGVVYPVIDRKDESSGSSSGKGSGIKEEVKSVVKERVEDIKETVTAFIP